MKTIKINRIDIGGIKSFPPESIAIAFTDGINLIRGDNGAGKSTVIESFMVALFGSNQKATPMKKSQFINENQRKGEIRAEVEIDGKTYTILRELKQSGSGEDKLFECSIDNLEYESPKAQGTTYVSEDILKLLSTDKLNVDIDNVKNLIVSSQGEINTLANGRLSDLFKKINNLEKYDHAFSHMREVVKKYEVRCNQLKGSLKTEKDHLDSDTSKKELEDTKKEISELQKEINDLTGQLKILKQELKPLEEQYKRIEQLPELIASKLKEVKRNEIEEQRKIQEICNLGVLSDHLTKTQIKKTSKIWQKTKDTSKKESENLEAKRKEIEAEIANLQLSKSELTGEKQTKEGYISKYKSKLKAYLDTESLPDDDWLDLLQSKSDEYKHKQQTLQKEYQTSVTLEGHISHTADSLKEKKKEQDDLTTKTEDFERSIAELGLDLEFFDTFDDTKTNESITEMEKELAELQKEINDLSGSQAAKTEIEQDTIILVEDMKKLLEEDISICPKCNKPVSVEDLRLMMKDMDDKVKELRKDIIKLAKDQKALASKKTTINGKINPLKANITAFKEWRTQAKEYKKNIEKMKTVVEERSSLTTILENLQAPKKSSVQLTAEIESITNHKLSCNELRAEFNEYQNNKTKLKELTISWQEVEDKLLKLFGAVAEDSELNLEISQMRTQHDTAEEICHKMESLQGHRKATQNSKQELKEFNDELKKLSEQFDKVVYKTNDEAIILMEVKETGLRATKQRLDETDIPIKEQRYKDYKLKLKGYSQSKQELNELERKLKKTEQIRVCIREIPNELLLRQRKGIGETTTVILKDSFQTNMQKIEITDDNTVSVTFNGNKKRTFEQLSGGQKSIVSFSLRIAFSRAVSDCKLMIFDEPTDSLDVKKTQYFVNNFTQNSNLPQQLILISHNQGFERLADNIVNLRETTRGYTELVIQ